MSSDSMVKTELFLLMVSSAVCYVEVQMSVCALLQDFSLLRAHFWGTTVLFHATHAYESKWKYRIPHQLNFGLPSLLRH